MDCVVAPLLHVYELPEFAVNTTLFPWQKVTGPPALIEAVGAVLIVRLTAVLVLLSQPVALFTATA